MNSFFRTLLYNFIAAVAILIFAKDASAIQASRRPITARQPDGSTITIVRRGDERRNAIFSPDGIRLEADPVRGFIKATDASVPDGPLSTRGRATRKAATRGPGLFSAGFPTTGKQKGLVILVEFTDRAFNTVTSAACRDVDPAEYFNDMLNAPGFSLFGATGSARDWFISNSGGRFEPEFDVYGPVTLSEPMSYYGRNNRRGEDANAYEMIEDACRMLDGEIDFREYDRDSDGYVDNVYVFYAGFGEADSEFSDTVWPHNWEISAASGTGSPMFDGVRVDRYACSNETERETGLFVGIGTFIHEFSHVMGLPDLYCTDGYLLWQEYPFTPGEFSVMDYGPYNNGGRTPPNYSAYERYALDWIEPRRLTASGDYSLKDLASCNEAYLIPGDRGQEYFLLENRQLSGWDEFLPGHGMLVWHIDYNWEIFYDNRVNNDRSHQCVDLIEADGIQDYPADADMNRTDTQSGDPFPGAMNVSSFDKTTDPAFLSWSGKSTGIGLSGIRETDGEITFSVTSDESGIEEIIPDQSALEEIYTLQGIRVNSRPLSPGIYILKSGNKSRKILIK